MRKLEQTFRHDQICSLVAVQDRHLAEHSYLLSYPAYSPDLAPHDFFVFNYMKSKVCLAPRSKNLDELWQKIQQVWNEVPEDMCQKVLREYHMQLSDYG